METLERLSRSQPVHPRLFVMAYIGVDKEKAIGLLQRMVAERSHHITALKVEPGLDPLRDDPRFQELLLRVGLAS